MTTETKDFVNDMFRQAAENFRMTMDAGLKAQEQVAKIWTNPMDFNHMVEDMRHRGEKASHDYLNMIEKNVKQFQSQFEEGSRASVDMLRKAFDAAQSGTTADLRDRTSKLWEQSLDSVRGYTDAMMKNQAEMIDGMTKMFSKAFNGHETKRPETPAPKKS